jgi:hypothetical protein
VRDFATRGTRKSKWEGDEVLIMKDEGNKGVGEEEGSRSQRR